MREVTAFQNVEIGIYLHTPKLQQRVQSDQLQPEDRTVLGLLQIAGVELSALMSTENYEQSRAKLEAISNAISDRVFEYWTQNRELEVLFDIKSDPQEQAPFNNGNNLYIRIRNQRHRVSVPFNLRSRGFIWFFSFMAWFDSIKQHLNANDDLILLLDEPGLSLHALAQADFLRYIDELAKRYQILYTTHSPFMVHSDRLYQVRTVEDQLGHGTRISDNVAGSDAKTLFPLQAALGYTIAQNLFISKRNLLVEGAADLVYLNFFSALLDQQRRTSLRDDVSVVPVGGLNNLATFVALLRGNELELVVLHDFEKGADTRLEALVREKIIRERQVLNYAMFRTSSSHAPTSKSSDVEDMISSEAYLKLFNATFENTLGGREISVSDLPPGDRIVDQIGRYLNANTIQLRPTGGYNHYLVANYLASHPLFSQEIDCGTLDRFDRLFQTINRLYGC